MNTRAAALAGLQEQVWDLLIIGGGSTGLGAAIDAISRGYRTLLLEQSDFAKATSSRSTKLIHGGVRYLQQGNLSLVRESLHERGLLLRNAPDFVHPLEFVIPARSWMEKLYYGAGLKAYDLLAGKLGMQRSQLLSLAETRHRLPALKTQGLAGGVSYFDAQFDDARLAVGLAHFITQQGGTALNYVRVTSLQKERGKVCGVEAVDGETGDSYRIAAKAVINATGIFSDEIRSMDDVSSEPTLALSQGAHIVVDRRYCPGKTAMIIPKTDDGRVLFIIPWLGATLIGTTDIPVKAPLLEPHPLYDEIEFLIDHANRYLSQPLGRSDIRSCFAGLRPLVKAPSASATSQISRDHVIRVADSGLISISGGKWTTFRRMGADVVATAMRVAGLPQQPSRTETLPIHRDATESPSDRNEVSVPQDDFVRHCVRALHARTVEDVLARRSRLLFLHASEALRHAPHVAHLLAEELHQDEHWVATQIEEFRETARNFLPVSSNAPAPSP